LVAVVIFGENVDSLLQQQKNLESVG